MEVCIFRQVFLNSGLFVCFTEMSEEDTLDWSNQGLKKLTKPTPAQSKVSKLILDNNDLTRLDCIDSFTALKSVSFSL